MRVCIEKVDILSLNKSTLMWHMLYVGINHGEVFSLLMAPTKYFSSTDQLDLGNAY